MWGGLLALSFCASVFVRADGRGLSGRVGFARIDIRWQDVVELRLFGGHTGPGALQLKLTPEARQRLDGAPRAHLPGFDLALRLPGLVPEQACAQLLALRQAGEREADPRASHKPSDRWAVPAGVEVYLGLEKSPPPQTLLSVRVFLGGRDIDAVAAAARVLAVRAADENRWDAMFTGKIEVVVSAQRTPISPALRQKMDDAVAGARQEIAKRDWTVVGGAALHVTWTTMGPEEPGAARLG